jgi:hypothetical protein
MGLNSFKPEIWSARLMDHLDKAHVLVNLCNRDYEGEIRAYGDTVKIGQIGPITVGNYKPGATTITPEQLSGTQTLLTIDQSEYFAFKIEDIDQAQTKPKLMDKALQRAAYALADSVDAKIGDLYAQAGLSLTTNGSTAVNSSTILAVLAAASQKLDEANVPSAGRWLAAPPWFIARMKIAKILQTDGSVDANATFTTGVLGNVMGFDAYMSNNIETSGTGHAHTSYVMAGTRDAITFAEQIVETEAYRPESSFSDAVKGLHVYGYKVTQPKCLLSITAVETTEV